MPQADIEDNILEGFQIELMDQFFLRPSVTLIMFCAPKVEPAETAAPATTAAPTTGWFPHTGCEISIIHGLCVGATLGVSICFMLLC